jgi:hypothetical protein
MVTPDWLDDQSAARVYLVMSDFVRKRHVEQILDYARHRSLRDLERVVISLGVRITGVALIEVLKKFRCGERIPFEDIQNSITGNGRFLADCIGKAWLEWGWSRGMSNPVEIRWLTSNIQVMLPDLPQYRKMTLLLNRIAKIGLRSQLLPHSKPMVSTDVIIPDIQPISTQQVITEPVRSPDICASTGGADTAAYEAEPQRTTRMAKPLREYQADYRKAYNSLRERIRKEPGYMKVNTEDFVAELKVEGVKPTTFYKFLSGELNPTLDTYKRLVAAFATLNIEGEYRKFVNRLFQRKAPKK